MKHQQRRVQKRTRTHSALRAHFLDNAPNHIVGWIIQKRLCQGFLKKKIHSQFSFFMFRSFSLYHFSNPLIEESMRFFPNLTFFRFSSTLYYYRTPFCWQRQIQVVFSGFKRRMTRLYIIIYSVSHMEYILTCPTHIANSVIYIYSIKLKLAEANQLQVAASSLTVELHLLESGWSL